MLRWGAMVYNFIVNNPNDMFSMYATASLQKWEFYYFQIWD